MSVQSLPNRRPRPYVKRSHTDLLGKWAHSSPHCKLQPRQTRSNALDKRALPRRWRARQAPQHPPSPHPLPPAGAPAAAAELRPPTAAPGPTRRAAALPAGPPRCKGVRVRSAMWPPLQRPRPQPAAKRPSRLRPSPPPAPARHQPPRLLPVAAAPQTAPRFAGAGRAAWRSTAMLVGVCACSLAGGVSCSHLYNGVMQGLRVECKTSGLRGLSGETLMQLHQILQLCTAASCRQASTGATYGATFVLHV